MLKKFCFRKATSRQKSRVTLVKSVGFLGIFQRFPRIRGCKVLAVNLVRTSAAGAPEIDSVDPRISDF